MVLPEIMGRAGRITPIPIDYTRCGRPCSVYAGKASSRVGRSFELESGG